MAYETPYLTPLTSPSQVQQRPPGIPEGHRVVYTWMQGQQEHQFSPRRWGGRGGGIL